MSPTGSRVRTTESSALPIGGPPMPAPRPDHRYVKPGTFTVHVFNRLFRRLTLLGISVRGSRVLRVRGRKSGAWRSTVVNLLDHEGQRYLVAPRGTTDWVRNIRVTGTGELKVGRRVEPFAAVELDDADKPEILRSYLRHWKWEVGQFFDGVGPTATDGELLAIA